MREFFTVIPFLFFMQPFHKGFEYLSEKGDHRHRGQHCVAMPVWPDDGVGVGIVLQDGIGVFDDGHVVSSSSSDGYKRALAGSAWL